MNVENKRQMKKIVFKYLRNKPYFRPSIFDICTEKDTSRNVWFLGYWQGMMKLFWLLKFTKNNS